eukprot:947210-Pyramimonas_sp.AAC.1
MEDRIRRMMCPAALLATSTATYFVRNCLHHCTTTAASPIQVTSVFLEMSSEILEDLAMCAAPQTTSFTSAADILSPWEPCTSIHARWPSLSGSILNEKA